MILDFIVLGILIASAVVAFTRGFVREVLTIGSLAGAALATLAFGPALTPLTRGWIIDPNATEPQVLFGMIPYDMLVPVAAYAIVFITVLIALTIITHLVSKGVHAAGLGPVDRSLGVVFGLVRGVIIIGLLTLILNFVLSEEQRTQYFKDAKTYVYVDQLSQLTNAMLPDREFIDKLKGKKEEEKLGHQPLEPGQSKPPRQQVSTTKSEQPAPAQKPARTPNQFNN